MGSKTSGRHVCVLLYDKNEFPVALFESTKEMAKYLNFKEDSVRHAISRCTAGKQKFIYDSKGNVYTLYKVKEG